MVNHEDAKIMFNGSITEVKRSQRITSVRYLSERWGWSPTKTKKFLDQLKSDGMIDYFSDTKKTVVTIGNYDLYQYDKTKKVTPKNIKSKTEVKQKNTNNNDNNENNDNNICTQQVEQLWSLYPNKQGKAKAIEKIPKLIDQYGYEKIEACIKRYAEEVKGRDRKYIKHGSTFFNGGYMDYLDDNIDGPSSSERELRFDQYTDAHYYMDNGNRIYVDLEDKDK